VWPDRLAFTLGFDAASKERALTPLRSSRA
jgi:hypothetical protein